MPQAILNTAVTFIVTTTLGSCLVLIKNVMKEFRNLKESQLMDMKNDLSNKFFVYDAMEEVEDYLVMGFREKCERYFHMNGDSWIHPMYDKSFQWKIRQTGYLR